MKAIFKKFGWWIFAFLCTIIGLYPALYFILDRNFGLLQSKTEELLLNPIWNAAFYTHIILGGLSLLIGWTQFPKAFRDKNRKIHKKIGMAYVTFAFFSSLAGIYIGLYATGGIVSIMGFVFLGIIWLFTTMMGWVTAKRLNFDAHEDWMIYSYAACFAAVTLRIWLPILITLHQGEFIPAYRMVAWLCWVPNMVVAFWLVRKRQVLRQSY
ncbi:DUF2306 domain-containing protein [Algoriphagus halophytocola]|uniref:DUF2306 domain-containing protein n=1 Tax=Algoriphagus halophytocola TaxID=2991499 RepID=A0ABY6MKY6_9BACT|nr:MULTISPECIES: DUF2306 domain-containing protein [unclassified Algoriphagus]UZD23624.1 DUF2306 domain-containing protein [Algoriphagus sp. TR-M5]WBL44917.1 DUF2306 domain-containing protein [Algoriphagus sp. TR-M9]